MVRTMKLHMRYIAFTLSFCFLFLSFNVGSVDTATTKARTSQEAILYIESFAHDMNNQEEYDVIQTCKINSFTKNKSYILFTLFPKGYAIYDEISGIIEEMQLDSDSPYNDKYGEAYYGGPLNYLLKRNDEFYNILNDEHITEEDILYLYDLEVYTVNNRSGSKGLPTTTNNWYINNTSYFTSLLGDDFGYNNTGICTQIACQIILGYYDNYVNTKYVPANYRSGYGTTSSFLTLLESFIGTTSSGLSNAASGINTYFNSIFFPSTSASYDIGNHNTVFTRVSNNVSNNRPTVIAMFNSYNSNCSMNHSVVAYGYREELTGMVMTSATYYVHNGWHNNYLGAYAWDWFADDLVIN